MSRHHSATMFSSLEEWLSIPAKDGVVRLRRLSFSRAADVEPTGEP